MRFKVSFARVVNEAQLVEGVIEAPSEEEAIKKLSTNDFERFLIVKRELRNVTNVGSPDFERLT